MSKYFSFWKTFVINHGYLGLLDKSYKTYLCSFLKNLWKPESKNNDNTSVFSPSMSLYPYLSQFNQWKPHFILIKSNMQRLSHSNKIYLCSFWKFTKTRIQNNDNTSVFSPSISLYLYLSQFNQWKPHFILIKSNMQRFLIPMCITKKSFRILVKSDKTCSRGLIIFTFEILRGPAGLNIVIPHNHRNP